MPIDGDIGISHIRRGNKSTRIELFRAYLAVSGLLGTYIDMRRENLIKDIEAGKKVVTVYEKNGAWQEGADVHYTRKGYRRTDHNDTEEDNLGSLPEF